MGKVAAGEGIGLYQKAYAIIATNTLYQKMMENTILHVINRNTSQPVLTYFWHSTRNLQFRLDFSQIVIERSYLHGTS